MKRKNMSIDLDSIRQRLAASSGPRYWRGLEELADTKEFEELLRREFPDSASTWNDP
jgi:molybdopterin-containing oxidoreductase family iron-sulfur binding subunit